MSNRSRKITKIFLIVSSIVLVLPLLGGLYGNVSNKYKNVSVNGIGTHKNLTDLIKVSCFSTKKAYKKASLAVIESAKKDVDNYKIETLFNFEEDCYVKIEMCVKENESLGFMYAQNGEEMSARYDVYSMCENGIVKTYIKDGDSWKYIANIGNNVEVDCNKLLELFKTLRYKDFPHFDDGLCDYMNLKPDSDYCDELYICKHGYIFKYVTSTLSNGRISEFAESDFKINSNAVINEVCLTAFNNNRKISIEHSFSLFDLSYFHTPEGIESAVESDRILPAEILEIVEG